MTPAGKTTTGVTIGDHARAIVSLPFVNAVAIPAVIVATTGPGLPVRMGGVDALRVAVAIVIAVTGAALVAHCIALFVRHGRGTLAPWDPTRSLVLRGAYRYSRNPMKAGLCAVLLGEALLLASLPLFAWFACFALVNAAYIRFHEEPGLHERFGAAYRDYCARVPRWIPRLTTRAAFPATPKENVCDPPSR